MTKRLIALSIVLATTVTGSLYLAHVNRTARAEIASEAIKHAYGAPLDCTIHGRMRAANVHYRAACMLTAMRICSEFWLFRRTKCYEINLADCDKQADRYEAWLRLQVKEPSI